MTQTFAVEVERDGRWWLISIPEIGQVTQARRVADIETMARSLVAVSTDLPAADVHIMVSSITVPGVGDILDAVARVETLRRRATELGAEAAAAVKQFACDLTREGVPVRDAAALLGVSPQRISQLARR